jgi:hypothetical protein
MPNRPNLKQFGQLVLDDFVTRPVWASCHSVDYDRPWYNDTDEETFRQFAPVESGLRRLHLGLYRVANFFDR